MYGLYDIDGNEVMRGNRKSIAKYLGICVNVMPYYNDQYVYNKKNEQKYMVKKLKVNKWWYEYTAYLDGKKIATGSSQEVAQAIIQLPQLVMRYARTGHVVKSQLGKLRITKAVYRG